MLQQKHEKTRQNSNEQQQSMRQVGNCLTIGKRTATATTQRPGNYRTQLLTVANCCRCSLNMFVCDRMFCACAINFLQEQQQRSL